MKKNTSNLSPVKPAPQRTCIVCRQVKTKRELVRLVRTPAGEIELDVKGKKEGRGAYICRERGCWEKLVKGKQLEHALKSAIKQEELEQLIKNGKDLFKE